MGPYIYTTNQEVLDRLSYAMRQQKQFVFIVTMNFLALCLSVSVIIGWLIKNDSIIQLHPQLVPMQFNTALGILMASLGGLIALYRSRTWAALLWAATGLMGLLTLLQYILSLDFGIDQLFVVDYINVRVSNPGRMAPNTALSFTFIGLLSIYWLLPFSMFIRVIATNILGMLVVALGIVALIGYANGVRIDNWWGELTLMSINTAMAFILIGLATVFFSFYVGIKEQASMHRVFPISLFFAGMLVSFGLYQSSRIHQFQSLEQSLESKRLFIRTDARNMLETHAKIVKRLAMRWELGGDMTAEEWRYDALFYVDEMPTIHRIDRLNADMKPIWTQSAVSGYLFQDVNSFNLFERETFSSAILQSSVTRRPVHSRIVSDAGGGATFITVAPLISDSKLDGFIVILTRVSDFFRVIMNGKDQHFNVKIRANNMLVYGSDVISSEAENAYGIRSWENINGLLFTLSISPTRQEKDFYVNWLPVFTFVYGFIISCLVAYLVYVMHQSALRARIVEELHAEMERSNVQLKQNNEELESFIYIASHDLRSPLRAIYNISSWVKEDIDNKEQTEEYLGIMQSRVRRMEKLLDDLLEYSRVGRVNQVAREADTKQMIKDVFALEHKTERFTLHLDENLPVFRTFVTPLEVVFRNLIGNTLKHHTGEQGNIWVNVETDASHFTFIFRDDGPGIEGKYHERVFGMFKTLESRDKVEGSGMGLALIQKIVDTYGGSIRLESELGQGCSTLR